MKPLAPRYPPNPGRIAGSPGGRTTDVPTVGGFEALFSPCRERSGMVLSRKVVVETLASAIPVVLFVGALVAISSMYVGESGLSATGGQMLVAALVGFVAVMAGVGVFLARSDYDEEEDEDEA